MRALLRLALGGSRTRLVLQNPDDVALFRHASLVNLAHVRLIPGSGVDCRRFAPVGGAAEGAVQSSAGPAPAGVKVTVPGETQPLRVLLPARLLWDKGLAEFVHAARALRAQGRRVNFILAGLPDPGNPAAVPQETVRAWVAEGVVQWLGHVDDMPALMRSVDVVALPSYREGLPKGLIEAAACGLPLVTTDVPGCRHVVTDGVEGLLVPAKDADALAAAIARLQDSPALRESLGHAARERAVREFDERSVVRRTLDVYADLLG